MITLNKPWSEYERQITRHRRHETARRALCILLYAVGTFLLGIALGLLLHP